MNKSDSLIVPMARERQLLIRDKLAADGRVVAADLARQFETSEDTIRRDLRLLAEEGACRRIYGGALPVSPASGSLALRRNQGTAAKARLAATAARLPQAGQCIVFDAGSTNLAIAAALPATLPLTVVTNALSIAALFEDRPAVSLVVLGGRHDRATGGLLGLAAIRAAERLRPDLYFVGACALDPVAGLTVFDGEDAELKRTLAEGAAALAVAVTDDKLGTVATHRVVPWAALHHIVVETERSLAERIRPLPATGPSCHVAAAEHRS